MDTISEIERIIEDTVEHDAFGLHRVDEAATAIVRQLSADLSAAREQLAEMREALEWIVDGVYYGDYSYITDYAHAIRNRAKQALSAAPAGGRVVFRQESSPMHIGGFYRGGTYLPAKTRYRVNPIVVEGHQGKESNRIVITVTEAPPSADEE